MLHREWITASPDQPWMYQQYLVSKIPFYLHYHPEYELCYTRHAEGLRYVSGEAGRFDDCDLVLVAPNQPHSWESRPNPDGRLQRLQLVFFRNSWLPRLAEAGLPELRAICTWLEGVPHGLRFSADLARELAPFFDRLHDSRGLERAAMLLELLGRLSRDTAAQPLKALGAAFRPDSRVRIALEYMEHHFTHALTLTEVASVAATSETNLKRLLNRHIGRSFTELLTELRITHACNLLLSGQTSLEGVAHQSGFQSLSHFHRTFQKRTGKTPAAYRKLRQLTASMAT
ncbi:helix-turn-helix domain-containing protein [Chitinibacteraceae bacterium HSL-7]